MTTEATADLALDGLVAGPPRVLRVALASRAAAYLADPDTDETLVALLAHGAVVVPDAIVLPRGMRWEDVLRAHLADDRPVLLGDGVLRCSAVVVPVVARNDSRTRVGAGDPATAARR
ncbi:MAG TPA: hypothetical protein VGE77_05215, partial [Nocardioides sp.]